MDDHLLLTETPGEDVLAQWLDLLRHSSYANHYVAPDFFTDPFVGDGERFALLLYSGGRVDAVITGTKNNGRLRSGLGVRPQAVFRDGVDRSTLAEPLARSLKQFGGRDTGLISFYSWEPIGNMSRYGYCEDRCTGSDMVVMLDTTRDTRELFKEVSSRRRSMIRRLKNDGSIETKLLETEDELDEMYEVHRRWCADKGIEPDDPTSFRVVLRREHRAVIIAKYDGRVVAGTFLRYFQGKVVEYAANNSLSEYNHLHANELLGWCAIEWACEQEFTRFSLGASHPFLARFGGTIVGAYRYWIDRTFLRIHTNMERLSGIAVRTYQSLPSSVRKGLKAAAGV